MQKKILLILLFFFSLTAYSQTNTSFSGKVIDTSNNEPLIGAFVTTLDGGKGAATDIDGNFVINSLNGSQFEIKCSYIGYKDKIIKINLEELNDDLIIKMSPDGVVLDHVEVVARKISRSEASVVALQKKSSTIISGISRQQMSSAGASNAASALKKVTGVNVQEGKYVYVRGLSDRYGKTLLNGAIIPSLDPERNTVQMDLFPGNILENILVFKTFSPKLPGDFAGGLVDIKTIDFPDNFTLGFSIKAGYSPQSSLRPDFLTFEGGKLDFLGVPDRTYNIPEKAKGDIPERYVDNEKLNSITKSFNKIWNVKNAQSGLDQGYSLSFGNRLKIKKKVFGYLVGMSYSNNFKYDGNGSYSRYKLISKEDELLNRQIESQNVRVGKYGSTWSIMSSLGYRFDTKNSIGLTLINSHNGIKYASEINFLDFKNDNGKNEGKYFLEFVSRNFATAQLKGNHTLENGFDINWINSYTNAIQNEPDTRYFIFDYVVNERNDTNYIVDKSSYSYPRRFFREMVDNLNSTKIDFEKETKIRDIYTKLNFGFSNDFVFRTYDQKQFIFAENNAVKYSDLEDFYSDDNIDAIHGIRVQTSVGDNLKNSYIGYQNVAATYGMANIQFSEKFKMIGGVRFQYIYMFTKSLKEPSGTEVLSGKINDPVLLPSLNMTYSPVSKFNLRFGYNRTVALPSFREMAPLTIENKEGDVVVGNPSITKTTIDNFDFRLEKYFNRGEVFSVGAFYKKFHNPIEQTFNTEAQNPEITWRNVEKGNIYGLEAELSKKLDFIPLLNNFKVTVNATYLKSQVSLDKKELASKRYFDPAYPDTRRMFEQPPYIINAGLFYKNPEIGLNVNLNYNYTGEKMVYVNPSGLPDIFQAPEYDMNLIITKKFGLAYSLSFTASNLLDKKTNIYYPYNGYHFEYVNKGWGRSYSLKFSYNLKKDN